MIAGWSSLVARWAHNPKVGGSNPSPLQKKTVTQIVITVFFISTTFKYFYEQK